MSDIAKWRDDINGTLTTGGTSTAYTITTNTDISGEASVPNGFEVAAKIHVDSGSAPTLAVDSHTAAPITYKTGFAPPAGMLEAGSRQRFVWDSSNSEWVVQHVTARDNTQVGAEVNYWGSTLPGGYVWANGTTIGNGSSNATGRANADCSALFSKLWAALANSEAPIYDSAGSTTSRGLNAAADFAANKALTLPDRRDNAAVGKGTMGGTSAAGRIVNSSPVSFDTSTLGKMGGADRDTLTAARLPVITPSGTVSIGNGTGVHRGGNQVDIPGGGGNVFHNLAQNYSTSDISATFAGSSFGSGQAHNNTQPSIVCNVIIKL